MGIHHPTGRRPPAPALVVLFALLSIALSSCSHSTSAQSPSKATKLDDIIAPATVDEALRIPLEQALAGHEGSIFFPGEPGLSCTIEKRLFSSHAQCAGAELHASSFESLIRQLNARAHFVESLRTIASNTAQVEDRLALDPMQFDIEPLSPAGLLVVRSKTPATRFEIEILDRGTLSVHVVSDLGSQFWRTASFETLRPLLHEHMRDVNESIARKRNRTLARELLGKALLPLSLDPPGNYGAVLLGQSTPDVIHVFRHPIHPRNEVHPTFDDGPEAKKRLKAATAGEPWEKVRITKVQAPIPTSTAFNVAYVELLDDKVVSITSARYYYEGRVTSENVVEVCRNLRDELPTLDKWPTSSPLAFTQLPMGCKLSLTHNDRRLTLDFDGSAQRVEVTLETELEERAAIAARDKKRNEEAQHQRECRQCARLRVGQTVRRYAKVTHIDRDRCVMRIEQTSAGMPTGSSTPPESLSEPAEVPCDSSNEY
ncbi:MAG: hypothetical protein U0165_01325 [Polyangiaceae bacterium]